MRVACGSARSSKAAAGVPSAVAMAVAAVVAEVGGGGQRSAARACELTMEARMLRALARTSATLAAMRRLAVAAAARVGRPAARSEPWMAPRQAARSAASVGHVSLSMPKLSSSCQAP